MATFADASFLIALIDRRDQWHEAATALLPYATERNPLVMHALAVAEVIAVIGPRSGGRAAQQAWLAMADNIRVRHPEAADLEAAMEHVVRYDGRLSLSDALFVHYMGRGRHEILSFDADFDVAGLKRIATPP